MISIYHFYNIRSKIFSLIIIFLSLVSCNGQETISVKISNRSTIIIDSISLYNKKIKCKIRPKSDTIIDVDIKNIDTYNEGIVGMNLYQNGKQKNATIGFHDMGQISKFDIYVFNEGVFNTDKPIIPNEFYIYFSVAKNQSIDTIFKKKA